MKRPSVTNILAVLAALAIGATCSGCGGKSVVQPQPFVHQPDRLRFVQIEPIIPGPYYVGIWEAVRRCLNTNADITHYRFGVATRIEDHATRTLLWGVFAYVDWPGGTALSIVLDRQVQHSARVVSHEMIHAFGIPDNDWRLWLCEIQDGPYQLAERFMDEGA